MSPKGVVQHHVHGIDFIVTSLETLSVKGGPILDTSSRQGRFRLGTQIGTKILTASVSGSAAG